MRRPSRTPAVAVAATLTAALLGPAILAAPASAAPPSATTAPAAGIAQAVAPRAALAWKACEGSELKGAQCATLTVPRDWGDASIGGTFEVAVARFRSTGTPAQRIGSLFFNPGGPGGSGVRALSHVVEVLPPSIRQRFDLVSWDPRGVGQTTPAIEDCPGTTPAPPDTGPVDWAAFTSATMSSLGTAQAACWARDAAVAPYVGTGQVVRDLDALRAAVGDARITFWGMSYGTTIGREYARVFPGRVRTLLLDGTIAPDSTVYSYAREHIWDEQTALARFLGWLGPSGRAQYRRLDAALQDRTISLQNKTFTRWDLYDNVFGLVAYQSYWFEIVDLLEGASDVLAGDRSKRALDRLATRWESLSQADPLGGRTPWASGAGPREGDDSFSPVTSYVNCDDLTGRPTADELTAVVQQAVGTTGPWGGVAVLGEGSACAGLPAPAQPLPPVVALALRTPPVVLNSVADNRTPWLGARSTANAFTGARMLSYDSSEHVTWHIVGSACVDRPIDRYMLTGRLPAADAACNLVPPRRTS